MGRGRMPGTTKQKGRQKFTHQKAPAGRMRKQHNTASNGTNNGTLPRRA